MAQFGKLYSCQTSTPLVRRRFGDSLPDCQSVRCGRIGQLLGEADLAVASHLAYHRRLCCARRHGASASTVTVRIAPRSRRFIVADSARVYSLFHGEGNGEQDLISDRLVRPRSRALRCGDLDTPSFGAHQETERLGCGVNRSGFTAGGDIGSGSAPIRRDDLALPDDWPFESGRGQRPNT